MNFGMQVIIRQFTKRYKSSLVLYFLFCLCGMFVWSSVWILEDIFWQSNENSFREIYGTWNASVNISLVNDESILRKLKTGSGTLVFEKQAAADWNGLSGNLIFSSDFECYPIQIQQGRLPQSENEVIVSESFALNHGLVLNHLFVVKDAENTEREMVICGIYQTENKNIENNWYSYFGNSNGMTLIWSFEKEEQLQNWMDQNAESIQWVTLNTELNCRQYRNHPQYLLLFRILKTVGGFWCLIIWMYAWFVLREKWIPAKKQFLSLGAYEKWCTIVFLWMSLLMAAVSLSLSLLITGLIWTALFGKGFGILSDLLKLEASLSWAWLMPLFSGVWIFLISGFLERKIYSFPIKRSARKGFLSFRFEKLYRIWKDRTIPRAAALLLGAEICICVLMSSLFITMIENGKPANGSALSLNAMISRSYTPTIEGVLKDLSQIETGLNLSKYSNMVYSQGLAEEGILQTSQIIFSTEDQWKDIQYTVNLKNSDGVFLTWEQWESILDHKQNKLPAENENPKMVSVRLDQYMGDSVRLEVQGMDLVDHISGLDETTEHLVFVIGPVYWEKAFVQTPLSIQINVGLDPAERDVKKAVSALEEIAARYNMESVIVRDRNEEMKSYIRQIRVTAVIFTSLMITVLTSCITASLLQIQSWLLSQRKTSQVLIKEGMRLADWKKTVLQIEKQSCFHTGIWCSLILASAFLGLEKMQFLVWQGWLAGGLIPLLVSLQLMGTWVLVKREAAEIQIL